MVWVEMDRPKACSFSFHAELLAHVFCFWLSFKMFSFAQVVIPCRVARSFIQSRAFYPAKTIQQLPHLTANCIQQLPHLTANCFIILFPVESDSNFILPDTTSTTVARLVRFRVFYGKITIMLWGFHSPRHYYHRSRPFSRPLGPEHINYVFAKYRWVSLV